MISNTWQIGDAKVTQIPEFDAGALIQEIIASATTENISKITWLKPHFADDKNHLKALSSMFIIETGGLNIIVDTGIGNGKARRETKQWSNLQTDFFSRFEGHVFKRDTIDFVVCTHLHFDHVGWNTIKKNGKWVPTFPNARHCLVEQEFTYWKNRPKSEIIDDRDSFNDSVMPVFEAGLVDLVPADHQLTPGISLIPTPGHTPGHVSILIQSGGKQAVITGDVVHHPCQIAHPDWQSFDTDSEQALETRQVFLERFVDTETLIIGSHFANPVAGYLRRDKDAFRLVV